MKYQFVLVLLLLFMGSAVSDVSPAYGRSTTKSLVPAVLESGGKTVASLDVTINNSAAIIKTSYRIDDTRKVVSLYYSVIQNFDLYKRSMKSVSVQWDIEKLDLKQYHFDVFPTHTRITESDLRTISQAD